jgi:hypothetical protein
MAADVGDENSVSINTYTFYEYTGLTEWRRVGSMSFKMYTFRPLLIGRVIKNASGKILIGRTKSMNYWIMIKQIWEVWTLINLLNEACHVGFVHAVVN